MPKNTSQPALSMEGDWLTHFNAALPLHVVCTQVQVNFRNGSHPLPLTSPTSSCLNVKRYQIGQILLITPYHTSWRQDPPGLEWKYWQVFRNKTVISVWYFVKERNMKEDNVVIAVCSNHTGIHKDWEMLGRGAAAVGTDAHANSITPLLD